MKITKFLSLIFLCTLIKCPVEGQKLLVLPLEEAYKKQEIITTKDFIESFTYIPLETTPECLIGGNPKIALVDNFIIITDLTQCLIFEKSNGNFVRKIGHIGRDPGGYRSTQGFFNALTKTFYFPGWNNDLFKYSLEGKYLGKVVIPGANDSFTNAFVPEKFSYLNEKIFVCNIFNMDGLQSTLLMLFDENGKVIKSVPNRSVTKAHEIRISTGELNFYNYNNKLLYNEIYNDTIFNLSLNQITPYLVWNRGKYKVTQESQVKTLEQIRPIHFLESEKYITFTFSVLRKKRYFALYNKGNTKLKVCEYEKGIFNDTDGFVPFLPLTGFNGELVGLTQPLDIMNWVEDKKNMKKTIPAEFNKIISVEPTGNPVLTIARLKK